MSNTRTDGSEGTPTGGRGSYWREGLLLMGKGGTDG